MKKISVGYQPNNINAYFPGAWTCLDNGRKLAQREWAKYAAIVWAGAVRPNIYIKPSSKETYWAYTSRNTIWVTNSRKVWKTHWTNQATWMNLFMHELGHILIGLGHCKNPVPGTDGNCVMSITGKRVLKPCPSCLAKLQRKYGKPK